MAYSLPGFAGTSRYALYAGVAALALPAAAHAQDNAPAGVSLDGEDVETEQELERALGGNNVIVVTATKREQTLQEAPVSVSVTTGEVLERAEIRDLIDVQTVSPSLRVSQLQNSASTTFIIRGFGNGDNNFGIEPSVGVFIDGVFRSRSAGAIGDLANVNRIEVLRGPQSTLFGKNASAGVISVLTREPQFEFGGSVSATYGNYDQMVLKGDITGPITDSVAFSIDGGINKRDGYVTELNSGEDINTRDRWNARGQLLFDNNGPLRVRAIGDYSKIDELCCQVNNLVAGPTTPLVLAAGGSIITNDFFSDTARLNFLPVNEVESYGGSVQADLELGALNLTSITAYRELHNFQDQDVDFTGLDFIREVRDQDVETFTQEFRLTSNFDGPFNFLLGGFYFNEDITQFSSIINGQDSRTFFDLLAGSGTPGTLAGVEAQLGLPNGSIFAAGPSTIENFALSNESYSVFGTADITLLDDRLTLTAGFNYTDDKKDFALSQQSNDPLANINLADAYIIGAAGSAANFAALPAAQQQAIGQLAVTPCPAGVNNPAVCNPLLALAALQFLPPFLEIPNAVEDGKTRDDNFSYTLRASFEITPELNTYFTYATGFKASSVNLSRDSRPLFGDYIPATVPAGVPAVVAGSQFLSPSSPIRDAGLPITNLTTGSRFAGPEDAKVYEIGLKGNYPGISFNLALFDQSIEGFQSFLFTGTGFALANAGEQSTRGFEFDTVITPVDPLAFTFALTYLDATYDDFPNAQVGDLTGARPGGIPEFSIATSATYTHDFGASGNSLIGRVDYSHESNVFINNGLQTIRDNNFRREVNLVNASLTLALANGFEVTGFVRNAFNERYILTVFPSVAQQGSVSGYPNAPRTYGGTVRFKF
ncbi:TonB-dependent receptor [Citromicrobium bathyomarinum]|uniref:TonB-dependent receptor n=1 Tax=Sphingomonadales TaxID=204457 RepID=UPI000C3F591F|nr:TonB-dependent receptor [Citromicrobium sp.]